MEGGVFKHDNIDENGSLGNIDDNEADMKIYSPGYTGSVKYMSYCVGLTCCISLMEHN